MGVGQLLKSKNGGSVLRQRKKGVSILRQRQKEDTFAANQIIMDVEVEVSNFKVNQTKRQK